ncbi:Nup133 N terminal like-domain-containing protein [Pilobolus umbonatus]|nr:Nup133 N terminal like-domain-containing protein [Pilobolus umbonatus]
MVTFHYKKKVLVELPQKYDPIFKKARLPSLFPSFLSLFQQQHMENSCPEKAVNNLYQASVTIKSRAILDRQFPDIGKTFPASDAEVYTTGKTQAIQPVSIKNSLTMPVMGLEEISSLNVNNPCGIVPIINRAYFVVKNLLYLWDYVDSKDVSTIEEQDEIVGIGFTTPKAGIFNDNISQLLIISTTQQVKIIAMNYDIRTGLKIYDTGMSTNSSGVNMKQIIGTKHGRIFMLGADGNLWELDYRREEGWFSSKCSKRLHPSNSSMAFFIGSLHDPIIDIAVNDSGTVLYQLTASSAITVIYLDVNGMDYIKAETHSKICNDARLLCPKSPLIDSSHFKIISIHPTDAQESRLYQLVAITSTGCRLYFNLYKNDIHLQSNAKPNALELIHVSIPPPTDNVTEITKTFYNAGLYMFARKHKENHHDIITTASPDLGRLANHIGSLGTPVLSEFTNTLQLPGKVIAIKEPSIVCQINEFATSFTSPPRHIFVLTTTGLTVLTKQRPYDMLETLLNMTTPDTNARIRDFDSFFSHFGYVNCASLCFGILCAATQSVSLHADLTLISPTPSLITAGANELLDKFGQWNSVLNEKNGYQYTSRHDGLALFIYRVTQSIWEKKMIKEGVKNGVKTYSSNLSPYELRNIQQILRKLETYMNTNRFLAERKDNRQLEDKSLQLLYGFVACLIEAIAFYLYMLDTDISILMQSMKPESRDRFLNSSFSSLLTTMEGRSLATDLSTALIDSNFQKYDNTGFVIDVLQQHCGSFCGANDVLLYKAVKQIHSARTAINTNQARATLTESLNLLKKVALYITCDKMAEIAKEFTSQGYRIYGIQLALACANARDPNLVTNSYVDAGCPPNDARADMFKSKKPFYDVIFDLLLEITPKSEVLASHTDSTNIESFQVAFSSQDKAFHFYMYEKFMESKIGFVLIKLSPPYLEMFLKRTPFSYDRLSLLAEYYRWSGRYEEAARSYVLLAQSSDISNDERVELLTRASVCAKSVSAPTKQYEMYDLLQTIDRLLAGVHATQVQ